MLRNRWLIIGYYWPNNYGLLTCFLSEPERTFIFTTRNMRSGRAF